MTLGTTDDYIVYIYDPSSASWKEMESISYFKVIKLLNQESSFEITTYEMDATARAYIKELADMVFMVNDTLKLKGRIQRIEYQSEEEATIYGIGKEILLQDKEFIRNGEKRYDYINIDSDVIAKELLSKSTNGVSPWYMEPNTITNYGKLSIRFEYGDRIGALKGIVEATAQDWYVSQHTTTYEYDTDKFNIVDYKGSVSSLMTFYITGTNQNCTMSYNENDVGSATNYVSYLGYGDGINQFSTSTYAASTIWSTLESDITSGSTTIPLVDASSFPAYGTVRIMEEIITYTSKYLNTLVGCVRGTSSTTALEHKAGVYIEQYYPGTETDAQAGSSIKLNGLMEHTEVDRSLKDIPTMELLCSNYLIDYKDVPKRIRVVPSDDFDTIELLDTGDSVTVSDDGSGLSSAYRVVGWTFIDDNGSISTEFELSNNKLEFTKQMQISRQQAKAEGRYMKGSTNIYAVDAAENCDVTHPLTTRFFLPSETIILNRVLVNFKMKAFRAYNTSGDTSYNTDITPVACAGTEEASVSFLGSGWHDMKSITLPNTDCESVLVTVGVILLNNSSITSTGYTYYRLRLYDGTRYYPADDNTGLNSDGTLITGGWHWTRGPEKSGNCSILIPGNMKNKTITVQMSPSNAADSATQSFHVGIDYMMNSQHTHEITFGIYEDPGFASPSVEVKAGADGGTLTSKGTFITDQIELDITSICNAVGPGHWIAIEYTPNQKMRIEANVNVQLFIESK